MEDNDYWNFCEDVLPHKSGEYHVAFLRIEGDEFYHKIDWGRCEILYDKIELETYNVYPYLTLKEGIEFNKMRYNNRMFIFFAWANCITEGGHPIEFRELNKNEITTVKNLVGDLQELYKLNSHTEKRIELCQRRLGFPHLERTWRD